MASKRKRKNHIHIIQDRHSTFWQDKSMIHNTFLDYFNTIFKSFISIVSNRVHPNMKEYLDARARWSECSFLPALLGYYWL